MIIGIFTYAKKANCFKGDILTLGFQVSGVEIAANEKKNEKQPDYRVLATTPAGQFELGAGWKRTTDEGTDFVSVSLDGPLLSTRIDAALFFEKNGTDASLKWTRAKPKSKKAE
jgi:uncharacterized protein (DUF736 family)